MSLMEKYIKLDKKTSKNYDYFILKTDDGKKLFAKKLKVINNDTLENLNNEVEMNKLLVSKIPLPKIIEYDLTNDYVIIYDYVLGKTLNYCKFNYNECLEVIISICGILSKLHNLGYIHGDVKPSNFILNDNLYILDAGNVTKIGDKLEYATNSYCSPYQLSNRTAKVQFDFYSLGILIYEIFTGHKLEKKKEKILSEQIPQQLKRIIYKLVSDNMEDNYDNVDQIIRDINVLRGGVKMNREKYLPLGSVVILKEAKKRIMIIGFVASTNESENKVFDYMGCLYPEGVISSDKTLLFNHDQIDKIFYLGYSDNEEKDFKNKLNGMLNDLNNNK